MIKVGSKVTYSSYGVEMIGTVDRLSRDGSIVFLTTGKWLHLESVKEACEMTALTVHGTYGHLTVDADTGAILTRNHSGEYDDIVSFDVAAYRARFGSADLDADIMEIGYTLANGEKVESIK